MSRPQPIADLEPVAQRELRHDLHADIAHFARLRRRRHLERDGRYRGARREIERVLDGFEWDLSALASAVPRCTDRVRAVAWNVERGKRFEPLLGRLQDDPTLSNADLLMLTEVDIGMGRSGNRNVPAELAAALGMGYVYANHHLVLSPGDWNERAHGCGNSLAMHGSALLSRHPILGFRAVSLPEYVDKFHALEKRLGCKRALIVDVQLPDGPLTVVVVHLDPFAPPQHRAWQLELVVAELARTGCRRVLLGGDLNTTTYNLANGASLLVDILSKMARKGVAGVVAEYLDPSSASERPVFEVLTQRGFELGGFNEPDRGTLFCDTHEDELQAKARDYLPQPVFDWLQRKLEPWNGVVPLRLDWFAGRGVTPLAASVIERPTWRGQMISDHSPIRVDLALDDTRPAPAPLSGTHAPPRALPTRRWRRRGSGLAFRKPANARR